MVFRFCFLFFLNLLIQVIKRMLLESLNKKGSSDSHALGADSYIKISVSCFTMCQGLQWLWKSIRWYVDGLAPRYGSMYYISFDFYRKLQSSCTDVQISKKIMILGQYLCTIFWWLIRGDCFGLCQGISALIQKNIGASKQ